MQWKWLRVIFVPLLFSGCTAMKLIAEQLDPFAERPPCPIPGTIPDVAPDADCYYKLEITNSDKLNTEGMVDGRIPLAVVQDMKKYRDGDSAAQKALRDSFKTANYPRPIHREIPVKNSNDLMDDIKKNGNLVAYFVLEKGDEKYTYITKANVCKTKARLILKHAEAYEGRYEIPSDEDCPDLAKLLNENKKQTSN